MKILIVEDHAPVAAALRLLLLGPEPAVRALLAARQCGYAIS